MALEGRLSDFNLAEILQLISSQQKSGYLKLDATRKMVFIFDRGKLVSTRDRRSNTRDPLESYLKAYGFFNDKQWKHVEFVSQNSTLDLTEILVSENLLTQAKLMAVLQSLAQEMTTSGMRLRRGSYHFEPTKGCPKGIQSRFNIDIQGLLMEAARRLDEESQLRELLPHPNICFIQGEKVISQDALGETGQHIMSLTLAGLPLGRIIRQGRAESFVVRNLLKMWCQEGFIQIDDLAQTSTTHHQELARRFKFDLGFGLKRAPVFIVTVMLVMGLGWLRWTAPAAHDTLASETLRINQLRSEVRAAATLYRYRQGEWPQDLELLVNEGRLAPETLEVISVLGFKYELNSKNDSFSLRL